MGSKEVNDLVPESHAAGRGTGDIDVLLDGSWSMTFSERRSGFGAVRAHIPQEELA